MSTINVVVSGVVGVGKSTVAQIITDALKLQGMLVQFDDNTPSETFEKRICALKDRKQTAHVSTIDLKRGGRR